MDFLHHHQGQFLVDKWTSPFLPHVRIIFPAPLSASLRTYILSFESTIYRMRLFTKMQHSRRHWILRYSVQMLRMFLNTFLLNRYRKICISIRIRPFIIPANGVPITAYLSLQTCRYRKEHTRRLCSTGHMGIRQWRVHWRYGNLNGYTATYW